MDYFSSLYQKAMRETAKGLEKDLINKMQEIKTTLEEQKMKKIIVNEGVARFLDKILKGTSEKENVGWMVHKFLDVVSSEIGKRPMYISTQHWLDVQGVSVADIEQAFTHGWEVEYQFKDRDLVVPRDGGVIYEVETTNREGIWCAEKIRLFSRKALFQKGEIDLVCKAEDRQDLKQ